MDHSLTFTICSHNFWLSNWTPLWLPRTSKRQHILDYRFFILNCSEAPCVFRNEPTGRSPWRRLQTVHYRTALELHVQSKLRRYIVVRTQDTDHDSPARLYLHRTLDAGFSSLNWLPCWSHWWALWEIKVIPRGNCVVHSDCMPTFPQVPTLWTNPRRKPSKYCRARGHHPGCCYLACSCAPQIKAGSLTVYINPGRTNITEFSDRPEAEPWR